MAEWLLQVPLMFALTIPDPYYSAKRVEDGITLLLGDLASCTQMARMQYHYHAITGWEPLKSVVFSLAVAHYDNSEEEYGNYQ